MNRRLVQYDKCDLMKNDNIKQQYRVNEQIHVREVRVVGDDIESAVMSTREAIQLAEEKRT